MNTAVQTPPRNPFATRHTRPGRLVPRDADGEILDLAALLARVPPAAAIVGPHGVGKTNLLTALAERLSAEGRSAALLRSRTPSDGVTVSLAVVRARPGTTVCIDSWDRLGAMWTAVIRCVARLRCVGLLVTSHRATGMPTVARCGTTPTLLARLVKELPDHGGLVGPADVEQAFRTHGGDIREALYDLYDRFERRVRQE